MKTRFSKHYFTEKKDHIIKKMPNLTSDQKEELIAYFQKKPNLENKVDWNKWKTLTYADFKPALEPETFSQKKKAVKAKGIAGLKRGKDYLDFPIDNPDIQAYIPLTYNASRLIASDRVGGCTGQWCTAQQGTSHHWKNYVLQMEAVLVYIVTPEEKWAVAVYPDEINIYDARDRDVRIPTFDKRTGLGSEIQSKEAMKLYAAARKMILATVNVYERFDLDMDNMTINPDGSINYDADVDFSEKKLRKIPVRFGIVRGNFFCQGNYLTSLEGVPSNVEGDFDCSQNDLTSLRGGPVWVDGHFECVENKLTSLEGAPEKVGEDFSCFDNKLTSLEGAPRKVGGDFNCEYNELRTLKGAPSHVMSFYCFMNKLTSLEGAPHIVEGDFNCSDNSKKFTEEDVRNVVDVKGGIDV